MRSECLVTARAGLTFLVHFFDEEFDSLDMNWTLKITLSYNAKENKLRSACVPGINHEGASD